MNLSKEKIEQEEKLILDLTREREENYRKVQDMSSLDYVASGNVIKKLEELNRSIKAGQNRIRKLKDQ